MGVDLLARIAGLAVEVMLPLSLLVAAGAFWPVWFKDAPVAAMRTQLNRLVLYLFYPAILFAVAASTPVTGALLSVPLLVGIGSLASGALLYLILYRSPLGAGLPDATRAILLVGAMFGNTFNIGVPVLVFFYGAEAPRYAVFNDMLMTMPIIWSLGVWICTRLGGHPVDERPSVIKTMLGMPPIWAFVLGIAAQYSGLNYPPLIAAMRFIGQATIPVILFVLGLTIPWRKLTPRPEILVASGVKLVATPLLALAAALPLYQPLAEAQGAAVILASTPGMMTALVLADRFRLDAAAAALMIGWSTILFWLTLPLLMALGVVG